MAYQFAKCDYVIALEKCEVSCDSIILKFSNEDQYKECVRIATLCRQICRVCVRAYEAAWINRGKFMKRCMIICESCANICDFHQGILFSNCAESCRDCIRELKYVTA